MTKPNLFAFPKAITLDTLPDLLAFHRATFGGFRMEDPPEPTPPTPTPPVPTPPPAAFKAPESQDELNRIIGERLAREREKFADYADLKAKAEAHDAALEAAKTDAEKAIDAARKEGETSALSAVNARILKAEAKVLAAESKFRNPALAVATIDLSGVKVAEDGTVDADAIKAKLTALAASDPYLVDDGKKPAPKPDRSQGGAPQKAGSKSLAGLDGDALYDRLHPKKTS